MTDLTKFSDEKLKYSVLYAEDDKLVLTELSRILNLKFETVFIAENGADAFEIFKKEKPDIVITDIMMPKMTGIQLSEAIKELSPDTQIIVTTAYSDANFFMDAINCGVDKFLTKPIEIQKLFSAIQDVCDYIDMRREVKKSEKLLSEYKKAVDAGSIVSKTDKNGIITFVNDEFCRISGYAREELVGAPQNIVRHPNMAKEAFADMWKTILSGSVWNGLVENRAKDGASYWVEATIVPIMDENDEIVEFIGIRKDITELVRQEKELERLRAKEMRDSVDRAVKLNLKHLIELNPLPAFVVDKNDSVAEFNELFTSMLDPFSDNDALEALRSKKAGLLDLFAKDGLLKDYGECIIEWKDMPIGIDEECEKMFLKSKTSDSGFVPSLFRYEQDGEKFWIVYLR